MGFDDDDKAEITLIMFGMERIRATGIFVVLCKAVIWMSQLVVKLDEITLYEIS